MHGIKAFVGHSFGADDKDVVGKFLDHFRTLSRAYPEFSWDHAEEADLKTLSAKVLSKIQDKNVFIGICTRREHAVEHDSLSPVFFQKSTLKANVADFKWKTSDWIIQEIGLAIGRNMKLIIFLEEGVRPPGGLYGDLEYISFSRSHPHESFDRLLQMLVALSPAETTISPSEAQQVAETKPEKSSFFDVEIEPDSNWTQEKFDRALIDIIILGDRAKLDKINAAFKSSKFAQSENLATWEARNQYLRILSGLEPNFEALKRLSEANPTNPQILNFVARAYVQYDDHLSSARKYEEAASYSKSEKGTLENLGNAAIEYCKAGLRERALPLLERMKSEANHVPGLAGTVLKSLRELGNFEKDDNFQIVVMEMMVELEPSDTSTRFSLAYKHGQCENKDMALYHYLKIPASMRNATTWNNLGVSFGEFSMPVKSVEAFQRSADENETLAMSNLGFKLISAGFFKEAKEYSKRALDIPNYHKKRTFATYASKRSR